MSIASAELFDELEAPSLLVLLVFSFWDKLNHFRAFSMIPLLRIASQRKSIPSEPKILDKLSSSGQLSQTSKLWAWMENNIFK